MKTITSIIKTKKDEELTINFKHINEDGKPEWLEIKSTGKTAKFLDQVFKKNTHISLEGIIDTPVFEDELGRAKYNCAIGIKAVKH